MSEIIPKNSVTREHTPISDLLAPSQDSIKTLLKEKSFLNEFFYRRN